MTFEKYSDGKVYLAGADVLPTWVYYSANNWPATYRIMPLHIEDADSWAEQYGISDTTVNAMRKSYDRTWAIVGEGVEWTQNWLAEEKIAREDYYYDLAFFPEKYAQEAEEEVSEELPEETSEELTEETALPAAA